jgi:hypothetical protein
VLSNLLSTGFSALRGFATIAAWIAPTPLVFLIVQVFVSVVETCTLLVVVWILHAKEDPPAPWKCALSRTSGFAMGDGLAALLGMASTWETGSYWVILPLDVFRKYSLAVLITEVICASLLLSARPTTLISPI